MLRPSSTGGKRALVAFGLAVLVGSAYTAVHFFRDLGDSHPLALLPFLLLAVALFTALAFEFVNGFHDTANAVATVIYTRTLHPGAAVLWSGFWNFLGVLASSGVVAFNIIALLPPDLVLHVSSQAGFAMIFSLLASAILWNLGTWYLGLPSSSSHTLIGSVIGVGLASRLASGRGDLSGIDWSQAVNVGKALLFSPVIGFAIAWLLLIVAKILVRDPRLYRPPVGDKPPPPWIRFLLLLTCTGVSFAHGSNDGQKGMGLIMLILIGVVPTVYALNHAIPERETREMLLETNACIRVLDRYAPPGAISEADPATLATAFVQSHKLQPETVPAIRRLLQDVAVQLQSYKSLAEVPATQVANIRNKLFVLNQSLRALTKSPQIALSASDREALTAYRRRMDRAIQFIPSWVKVAVALALGLGTMVGWKRIVITVGEKIGKEHLTYAQGAAAEITAMTTIGFADLFGLPVSTTHVLSSGVAGTMTANGAGLQWATVRNLAAAWILTLPASIVLSGLLFTLLRWGS
ncbi:Low-affinity inorganic phosphate transporter 1 [Methylacidimicrobium cyclopophantes]|uniref:Phosphate transporter n=2 Tax=Methylacidimicrobium cyclopophantes TaxID=1041766 RepID=A0A5E6M9R3_9BACT|nr:inorganic phosphate transporter [Methylacidimicrobium cyclopophantes]VVM06135.1 Low-affinity inorganic phosphate transporter 1 [Methylacidimicrobium cyclopophantes]